MDISKAENIPGWMNTYELLWLASEAEKHRVIVEIGSYLGRSTRALADNTSGVVYAVDDWKGPRDVMLPPGARSQIFDKFLQNVDGLQGRLNVVKTDHSSIDIRDIPSLPDMVFIDGGHTYEDVLRDITFWLKHSTPGALISGHDYEGRPHVGGVFEAVNEVFSEVSVVPNTSIWYVEKSSHPFYRYSA